MSSVAPPVLRSALVARPVAEAFAVFTEEIGAWWPLPSHSVFGDEAGGVHVVDGRLVERAIDGRESIWAEVIEWDPPHRLVLAWHPGAGPGAAGRVEVRFSEDEAGTRVDLRHDGWEVFGDDALRRRRDYTGPSAWGHVLDHYADGVELRPDAVDLAELSAAYERFHAVADAATRDGGFVPPTDGGWTAEQVIAHVALNDLAMTAVAHALVDRGEPEFDNRSCQVRATLDTVVVGCGDVDGLIAFGRRCATQAIAAARRLDDEQRARAVPCRFESDGEVVLEAPMPWGRVAIEIQSGRHLPAHTGQLEALRP